MWTRYVIAVDIGLLPVTKVYLVKATKKANSKTTSSVETAVDTEQER